MTFKWMGKALSNESFGARSTAEEVAQFFTCPSSNLEGKLFIVTGANTGLGWETARVLAAQNAAVIVCSRGRENGVRAVSRIREKHPQARRVHALTLDLASLASIRDFVSELQDLLIQQSLPPVYALINNAGVMGCPKSLTKDGFEMQFGVNHLGHFYLTRLMLPLLEKGGSESDPARIINVSSLANWLFAPRPEGIKMQDLQGDDYNPWERYGQSKLANILFTWELQKRLSASRANIITVALHPGSILQTELIRYADFWSGLKAVALIAAGGWRKWWILMQEAMKTIEQGSATTIVAVLDPKIVPGGYYADCQPSDLIHPAATEDLASRLWIKSEALLEAN